MFIISILRLPVDSQLPQCTVLARHPQRRHAPMLRVLLAKLNHSLEPLALLLPFVLRLLVLLLHQSPYARLLLRFLLLLCVVEIPLQRLLKHTWRHQSIEREYCVTAIPAVQEVAHDCLVYHLPYGCHTLLLVLPQPRADGCLAVLCQSSQWSHGAAVLLDCCVPIINERRII